MSLPPPTTSAQFGAAIRLLRQAQDLSIEALAAEANIHWTYLSKIENGRSRPTWDVVGRLAGALEVELSEIARLAAEQASARRKAKP